MKDCLWKFCIWSTDERPTTIIRQSSDSLKNNILKKKILSMKDRARGVKQFDMDDLTSKLFDEKSFRNELFGF